MNEERQTARLENWIKYGPPESSWFCGNVYDHPNPDLPDGMWVYTSRILSISDDNKSAKTKNTDYALGEPIKNQ